MYNIFNIEKIGEDGTKYDIRIDFIDRNFKLDDIGVKPKGKRKYTYTCGTHMTNDYSFRKLSIEDRQSYKLEKMIEACPLNLINEALEEVWLSIKPEPITLK